MLERRIEEAGLNSWPALQQVLFDGWIMRFSQGYTKRANSVTPLYPGLLTAEEKIPGCERFYALRQQPTIFRLLSFSEESRYLDQMLAQRGYTTLDRTIVMVAEIEDKHTGASSALSLLDLENWFPLYLQLSQSKSELERQQRALLERIPYPLLCAVLFQGEQPMACGLGVLENEVMGLFSIVTSLAHRRQGFGSRLVSDMLAWGKGQGAQYGYLQVLAENEIAQKVYLRSGFRECYEYWYRRER